MSDPSFQTIRLGRGAHASPLHGACVVELASMLAGERFSDHPRTVCPVIAGFLRVYNDRLPKRELPELYPLAAMVVESRSARRVRRRRVHRLAAWAQEQDPRRRFGRHPCRDEVVVAAARAAAHLPDERRAAIVRALVADLVEMGHERVRPASVAAPSVPASVGASPHATAAAADAPDPLRVSSGG
jgi:hypothetical protein